MEPSSPERGPDETPPPSRMMGRSHSSPRSSISGLKPFVLAGLLVVIGLLVSLGALLRQSDEIGGDAVTEQVTDGAWAVDAPSDEPVPGAMNIGRPPGSPANVDRNGPAAGAADQSAPASEFTFYETLKKPSQDPAANVGLAPASAPKPAAPAVAKPAPLGVDPRGEAKPSSKVIETAEAGASSVRYTVQVGAFRQQPMAEEMIAKLNKKGHDAYLMVAQLPDGMTYRVRVGKFATREEAKRAAEGLAAKEGLHPFVATVQPNS